MGKIKAIKGLGKAFLEAVAGKGTQARNKASAKFFEKYKGTQARNKASAKFFEKYSGKKNVDKLFELEKKLKIKAKSRRIEKEIESKTGKK